MANPPCLALPLGVDRLSVPTYSPAIHVPNLNKLITNSYLGYELKEECLRLQRAGGTTTTSPPPSSSATALDKEAALPAAPDAVLVFADRVVAFDHVMGTVDLIAVVEAGGEGEAAGRAWLQETEARIRSLAMQEEEEEERRKEGEGGRLRFVPRVSPEEYMERVDRCLELIAAGETYEVRPWGLALLWCWW